MHVPAREQTALQVGFMPKCPTTLTCGDMLLMKMTCTLHSGTDFLTCMERHAEKTHGNIQLQMHGGAAPEGTNAIDGRDALPRKAQPGRALAP